MLKSFFGIKTRPPRSFRVKAKAYVPSYNVHTSALFHRAKNLYDTLEVTPSATQAQIKAAYYRLSMVHHPDKVKNVDGGTRFQEITDAYETLSNHDKRRGYDEGLFGKSSYGDTGQSDGLINNKRRRPAHLGKTEIFNFDEFYKMHYGQTLKKHKILKKEYKHHIENKDKRGINSLHITGLLLLIIFIGSVEFKKENDNYDIPPPKTD